MISWNRKGNTFCSKTFAVMATESTVALCTYSFFDQNRMIWISNDWIRIAQGSVSTIGKPAQMRRNSAGLMVMVFLIDKSWSSPPQARKDFQSYLGNCNIQIEPSTLFKQPLHFQRPKHRQNDMNDHAFPMDAESPTQSAEFTHITRCRTGPQWLIFITSFGRNYFYSIPFWFIIPHPSSWSLSIFQWDINKSLTSMSCGCLSHFISQRPCFLCLSCSSV